ncbi:hypothetical protein ASB1_05520 [Helicobacter heilmannii]|uniref:hypothetical protein n=1 Tax=Helicobacter heilmannii TaxID=35817 RepID=UPI0021F97065|nr:hypothetical protein [Helicobacter heilmannii]BDQ26876.1 hypothetical protein ASB1_05520 [Helicobacter heilmannii]
MPTLSKPLPGRAGDGVWPRIDNSTTPSLKSDLSAQEIKEAVKKWDLAHPKETDALNFALVKGLELTELKEVFKADKLLRQLRSTEVKESLDKGFSLEEVLNYTRHLPTSQRNIIGDELHYSKALENGKSLKIVETYQAPETLRFSRMDVVDERMPPPKVDETPNTPKGDEPQAGLPKDDEPQSPNTPNTPNTNGGAAVDFSQIAAQAKEQATELYSKAQAQEGGFRELLEGLTQPSSTLQADNLLKSVGSIESKLERKQGRVESLNDLLRGAIVAKNRDVINDQLAQIAIHFRDSNIPHRIEYKEYRASGYEGVHIHFKHNDVPAEIQLHTSKSWEVKKKQDEKYHIIREEENKRTLPFEQIEKLKQESRALGQESDLDIKLFTSFDVISTESTSAKSLKRLNADEEENLTHILRLKSNSKATSSDADMAYKRPDSELNQKEEIATGGKGIDSDIQTPLKNDSTTPPLKSTGKSRLQAALEEQQAKLEAKEAEIKAKALQDKENADKWRAKLAQITKEKQALAGLKDNDRLLHIGEPIPMQRLETKSSVSLDDQHIYPLDYAIVKATDLKPNFTSGTGTQVRTKPTPKLWTRSPKTLTHSRFS